MSLLATVMNRSLAWLPGLLFAAASFACSSSVVEENDTSRAGASSGGAAAGASPSVAGGGAGGAAAGSAGATSAGSAGALGMAGAAAGSAGSSSVDPGTDGDGIFMIGPQYTAAPELKPGAGVPQGKSFSFTYTAADTKIYPKTASRKIAVYVPSQYQAGTLAAVMVFQDGTDFYGFDSAVPPVFDNLIAQGKMPPVVAVFAGNGGGDYIGSERGLEYDTVSGLYAKWVDTELLPRIEQESKTRLPDQAITFTKNPEGRAALGGSSGGAASFSMAWWRPDLFRRVITFSGTYVNQVAGGTPFAHGAWIYHDIDPYQAAAPNGLIVAFCEKSDGTKTSSDVEPCDTPTTRAKCEAVAGCAWNTSKNKPLRVWLEAGSNDNGAKDSPSSYRNFYLANQRMAQALKARGYHFHFDDAKDAGHVDQGPLRQTLPSALVWLWRGYQPGT